MITNPDSTIDISSSPNTSEQFELDFDNYNKYIGNKVFINSTISSIAGFSIGYYLESGMFLHFYTYGLVASAVTVPFFTTNYLLRNVRKKNDIYNYALSGSLTGNIIYYKHILYLIIIDISIITITYTINNNRWFIRINERKEI